MAINACSVAVSAATYAIDKLYDYKIPESLSDDIRPGMRIEVPFGRGNRRCEAIVIAVKLVGDTSKLKPVDSILDSEPVLSQSLIKLAAYMCDSLFCTFFDCAKAMLPAGLWFKRNDIYRINEDISPEKLALLSVNNPVLRSFTEEKTFLTLQEIIQRNGGKSPINVLNKLCADGILCFESSFSKGISDKTVKMIELNIPTEDAYERAEKGRSAVRADIVSCLSSEGTVSQKELSYMTGASESVINTMVKQGILRSYRMEAFRTPEIRECPVGEPIVLSDVQNHAYEGMRELLNTDKPQAALLFGVTGSGKTQIYIKLIEDALRLDKGAVLLVPEIGLTPQMISKFVSYFGDKVAVLHSALSAGERYDGWKKIKSGASKVVIGTRSAVFAPVQNLGIIIIDEEQDAAYKSENSPRYHARDIAKYRVVQENALLVLGSATPSIESYYGAKMGKYPLFCLDERYAGTALPEVCIADMRGIIREGYGGSIGPVLYEELKHNLLAGEQSILFINRRGNSRQVTCAICGYTPECDSCSVPMTYHSVNGRIMCHYCGRSEKLPVVCPNCGSRHLKTAIAGTQKVEEELLESFPKARVLRMDADTTSTKNSHEKLLDTFSKGDADILIGTQMVTKGLDFENVTLVGVLDADQSLYAQDYRAKERTFALITQVVGRAGRRNTKGRAVIQTYSPENPIILAAARQDYQSFYDMEIETRAALLCPPVAQILVLTASGEAEHEVLAAMVHIKQRIEGLMAGQFADFKYNVLGPAPAGIVRVNRRYRYHLTFRCPDTKRRRELIGGILKEFYRDKLSRSVTLFADINPQDL